MDEELKDDLEEFTVSKDVLLAVSQTGAAASQSAALALRTCVLVQPELGAPYANVATG